jgi:hypothetical protein
MLSGSTWELVAKVSPLVAGVAGVMAASSACVSGYVK